MPNHVFYKSGDGHSCNDWGECTLCVLAVCKVCGLYEGSLTTDCPGVSVDSETSDKIYKGFLDYRESQGGWVRALNPTNQSILMGDLLEILEGRSQEKEAEFRLRYGIPKEEYLKLKTNLLKYLYTGNEN